MLLTEVPTLKRRAYPPPPKEEGKNKRLSDDQLSGGPCLQMNGRATEESGFNVRKLQRYRDHSLVSISDAKRVWDGHRNPRIQ